MSSIAAAERRRGSEDRLSRGGGVLKWLFFGITACPVLFVFAMIQMSSVTAPFWDHWEQAQFIVAYYDKGLAAAVHDTLVSLSQHSRPVTTRLIYLANGILTGWDVRSEYVYIYAALAIGLFIHYRIIRRNAQTRSVTTSEAALFSVISIVYLSPANHNNHWWSMMLQLDLNNVLSLGALSLVAFTNAWRAQIAAAALCWLSVYTLTNGLFLILIVAAISRISEGAPFGVTKRTVFWLINIAAVYWSYFPIAEPGMLARPSLFSVLMFAMAYVGNPVRQLIQFSYENQFEPAPGMVLSITIGVVLVCIFLLLVITFRSCFRQPMPGFLILLGFGCFALASAFVTGWARVAFDQYGIRNGNSSRYVITGSALLFGIMHFCFAEWDQVRATVRLRGLSGRRTRIISGTAYCLLLAVAARSYAMSIPIYTASSAFNGMLWKGFVANAAVTDVDRFLYPNQERLAMLRRDLWRLKVGPYRHVLPGTLSEGTLDLMERNELTDQFGVNGIRSDSVGRILFAHPHSRFALPLKSGSHTVTFKFGILASALKATPKPQRTLFVVSYRQPGGQSGELWSQSLSPTERAADIGIHVGTITVRGPADLVFETQAVASPQNLFAFWSDVIVD